MLITDIREPKHILEAQNNQKQKKNKNIFVRCTYNKFKFLID